MTVQRTIIQGISELLYTNDYVVVPGFGGFVARHQLAHYSLNRSVLHPPAKKVLFNVQLKQNDGILAGWLREKLGCDFAEVNKHLEDFAAYTKMLLETKRRLEFENLGLFYLDMENNICFEPRADVNFLIESFGLSSISLKELEPEPASEKPRIDTKDRFEKVETETVQPVRPRRNYRRIAALAVGLPVFAAALLFAASRMQPNSGFAANLFGGHGHGAYTPVSYTTPVNEITVQSPDPYVVDANGYASLNVLGDNKTTVVNISAVKTESKTITHHMVRNSSSFAGKYQVVLGCFGVTQNAQRLIDKLAKENISAGISGVNAKGLHVVSGGGFNDKESATALLLRIKDKCPSAWVLTN